MTDQTTYIKELEERIEELEDELQKNPTSEDDSFALMDKTGFPIHRKIHSLDEVGPHSDIWVTRPDGTWKLLKIQKSPHNGNIVMIMQRTETEQKTKKVKTGWFRTKKETYTETKEYYCGVKGRFSQWAHFPYSTGRVENDRMPESKWMVANAFWRILEEMGAPLERP